MPLETSSLDVSYDRDRLVPECADGPLALEPEQARDWYQHQPWLVGSNFLPSTAINELEMWQADTFDHQGIDKELGWAEAIGMNTMRVFLHDLLWQQDSAGFKRRIDEFLGIASKHHIRVVVQFEIHRSSLVLRVAT